MSGKTIYRETVNTQTNAVNASKSDGKSAVNALNDSVSGPKRCGRKKVESFTKFIGNLVRMLEVI